MIVTGTAHAQTPPPPLWYPPPYLAHVSIHAAPSTQLEVVPVGSQEGAPAVARCTEYCEFWALPGKYRVHAQDSSGTYKNLPLRIKTSSRFNLATGNESAATAGLALGISGSVALFAGALMTVPFLLCDRYCSSEEKSLASAGLGVLLAGALATPIGLVMYGENRPRVTRIDEASAAPRNPIKQLRVGVAGVGLGGLGLSGVASF